jgi:hypothetical protein
MNRPYDWGLGFLINKVFQEVNQIKTGSGFIDLHDNQD